jgi:hypothetical protein
VATNTTAYEKVMKDSMAPAIQEQIFNDTIVLKAFPKNSDHLVGRKFIVPLHTGRNEGIYARAEEGTLGTPHGQQFKEATWTPRYNWGGITVTQVLIEATRNNTGAYVRGVASETKGMAKDMGVDLNRQCYGDGTGLLETCGVTNAANLVVLASAAAMKHLRVGMHVDVLVKATGATSTGGVNRSITALSTTAKTITIDGAAITTDATFGVYRNGNYGLEISGLGVSVSATASYGGLDPAVAGNEFWKSTVLATGGVSRALTESLLDQVVDGPADACGEEPQFYLTTRGGRRAYKDLLFGMKRFMGASEPLDGFAAVECNGRPLVVDKDAPKGTFFALNKDHFEFAQMGEPGWKDNDGSILKDDGGTGYKATYYWFSEIVTALRAAHGRLDDITEG